MGANDTKREGTLLHHSNGIWTSVDLPDVSSKWTLYGIHFTSPNEGWAAGTDFAKGRGGLLKYSSNPVPDLTGQWGSLNQTCKTTKTTKCKITGSLNIQNTGTLNAPSSRVNFYLSDDEAYDAGDTFLKSVSTGSIKVGASKTKKLSYSLPVDESATGRYIWHCRDRCGGCGGGIEREQQSDPFLVPFHDPQSDSDRVPKWSRKGHDGSQ